METVNQQIIGENAGAKTNVGVDSIHIAKPLSTFYSLPHYHFIGNFVIRCS